MVCITDSDPLKHKDNGTGSVSYTHLDVYKRQTLASCCDDVLLLKAGPEIGVAATKTFTGQIAVLYLLAIYIAKVRGTLTPRMEKELIDELIRLPYKIEATLEREHVVEELASNLSLIHI